MLTHSKVQCSDLLSADRLKLLTADVKKQFFTATPFRHVTIEGLFSPDVLECVLDEFPDQKDPRWIVLDSAHQRVLRSGGDSWLGPHTKNLLAFFRSSIFISFLENVTGLDGLVADPHVGGIHMVLDGGYLDTHSDSNWNARLKLENRINLILYLNKDWDHNLGGELELWNPRTLHCEKRILPRFNRLVILPIDHQNHHGHSVPLRCGPGRSRKSVVATYCTTWRGSWLRRQAHLYEKSENTRMTKDLLIRMITPPILHGFLKRGKRRNSNR